MTRSLAVWKFASCDGCQLSLLDCEDELLPLAGELDIAYFLEAGRDEVRDHYDVSIVEGSITTAHDAERIREIRAHSGRLIATGACATAGGIQALRNFAAVDDFVSVVYASPQYISTLATSTPASTHVSGALHVRLRDGRVEAVRPRIYEPPRFFEAFLRGRAYTEVPDITARICGICPVAYQTSSMTAIEAACAVEVPETVWALRRLLYCGEWIESHALHVFFLHAPDFLGYPSAFAMARDHRAVVEGALALKKAGNALMRVVGGREIHPVNVRVGGVYRAPTRAELAPVASALEAVRAFARDAIAFTAGLPFPDFEEEFHFVALRDPDRYAIERGRLVSSGGLDLAPDQYEAHFAEEQVPHSTALHSRLRSGERYLVGPLARWALNRDRLSPAVLEAADAAGLEPVCRNPFRSIVVRAVETLYAVDEALRLIADYEPPGPPAVAVAPRAGAGCGWSEAPRELLWHRYALDGDGTILDARIVPPTSQNQARIEQSLHGFVERHADLPDAELQLRCEQAVRSYDPCISCATHFLRLEIDRC